jgi:hypothetical protein
VGADQLEHGFANYKLPPPFRSVSETRNATPLPSSASERHTRSSSTWYTQNTKGKDDLTYRYARAEYLHSPQVAVLPLSLSLPRSRRVCVRKPQRRVGQESKRCSERWTPGRRSVVQHLLLRVSHTFSSSGVGFFAGFSPEIVEG